MQKIINHWPFLVPALLMTIFLLSSLFGNHYLRNLEPYPDGLLYVAVPLEFVKSGQWSLVNQGLSILPNVPPLYSVLLLPIFLLWHAPEGYLLLNVVLQIGVLFLLYLTLKPLLKSKLLLTTALLLYGLNAAVLWYAVLPMPENLALLLMTVTIYLAAGKHQHQSLLMAVVAVGLLLTKYTYYPLAAILGVWSLLIPLAKKKYYTALPSLLILIVGVFTALAFQYSVRSGPLLGLLGITFPANNTFGVYSGELTFFSPEFLMTNIGFYVKSLLGWQSIILWQPVRLTSTLVSLAVVMGVYFSWKKDRWLTTGLLLLFLSQFIALRNFYVQDLRYALISIVFIIYFTGYFLSQVESIKKIGKFSLLIALLLLGSQVMVQAALLKNIAASNLLHRSQAWQQQAIMLIAQKGKLSEHTALVTALPPPLITAYTNPHYQILPLSPQQEFIANGQNIWTEELTDPNNLISQYHQWLKEGKELYITNAYITHQQAVIDDYEEYKNQFDFELVVEGCQGACNLFRLNLKTAE